MTYSDEEFLNSVFVPKTFFVPPFTEVKDAENIREATAKNIEDEVFPDTRIQRLDYTHDGRRFRAEVGKQDQRGEGTVLVILGPSKMRSLYYVATRDRGVMRGEPIMVGQNEVTKAYEFLSS